MFNLIGSTKTIIKQGQLIKDYDDENKILIEENTQLKQSIRRLGSEKDALDNENYKLKYEVKKFEKILSEIDTEISRQSNGSIINLKNRLRTILGGK